MYEYRLTVLSVVDGDTIHGQVDLGCDVSINLTLRLAHIDAPEIRTEEGKAAKAALTDLLLGGRADEYLVLRTLKDRREKYGRYLAELYWSTAAGVVDSTSVNDAMIALGQARPYEGGKR